LFYAFDAYADATTDVICNVISYVHRIGGPLFTVIIIGASLLAIFSRMPRPALFLLGVFVAVFFGAPQVVKKITGREACCFLEGQMMEDGKCVAAPGYEFVGQDTRWNHGKLKCPTKGRRVRYPAPMKKNNCINGYVNPDVDRIYCDTHG
jgi:hypothetical protein